MRKVVTGGIIAAVVIAVGGALYLTLRTSPTAPDARLEPITGPERAQEARELISELERAEIVDLDATLDSAQSFQSEGQVADAYLLLFYAARDGHGPSAFELATMNDPGHHSAQTSLLPEPDAFQAYRWYVVARDQGIADASARLDALHDWARNAAAAGNDAADRLLLQWAR